MVYAILAGVLAMLLCGCDRPQNTPKAMDEKKTEEQMPSNTPTATPETPIVPSSTPEK